MQGIAEIDVVESKVSDGGRKDLIRGGPKRFAKGNVSGKRSNEVEGVRMEVVHSDLGGVGRDGGDSVADEDAFRLVKLEARVFGPVK